MTHLPPPSATHPLHPYVAALEQEHEQSLDGHVNKPLSDLLASHQNTSAAMKVVVTRAAAPALPFGEPANGKNSL